MERPALRPRWFLRGPRYPRVHRHPPRHRRALRDPERVDEQGPLTPAPAPRRTHRVGPPTGGLARDQLRGGGSQGRRGEDLGYRAAGLAGGGYRRSSIYLELLAGETARDLLHHYLSHHIVLERLVDHLARSLVLQYRQRDLGLVHGSTSRSSYVLSLGGFTQLAAELLGQQLQERLLPLGQTLLLGNDLLDQLAVIGYHGAF